MALVLAVGQPALPPSSNTEARLTAFARNATLLTRRIDRSIIDDPAMRAEWRRVGFVIGCEIFHETSRQVRERHGPGLAAPTVAAIREIVPMERLKTMPVLSLSYGGLQTYRVRIESRLMASHAKQFEIASEDMRRTYTARLASLPTSPDSSANIVMPRSDLAATLNLKGAWDLDNPAHLGMACAEHTIPAPLRPTITIPKTRSN